MGTWTKTAFSYPAAQSAVFSDFFNVDITVHIHRILNMLLVFEKMNLCHLFRCVSFSTADEINIFFIYSLFMPTTGDGQLCVSWIGTWSYLYFPPKKMCNLYLPNKYSLENYIRRGAILKGKCNKYCFIWYNTNLILMSGKTALI